MVAKVDATEFADVEKMTKNNTTYALIDMTSQESQQSF